ncbi:YfaZ family outer membrane protein [Desulfurivibrio dismutans]|uniref:YfaZ family outer membrane protein n=1 Tax=Desulfurivibrio dismutans TaxID=1398908 RepID=UPI0023DB5F4B|nr:YfaZ family outer membrane protein [Desulfurivibrio alkaliphilus]MDF1614699.1 YfaZ family outer membrane protein [Desulfurivibrio alkaliphilus]
MRKLITAALAALALTGAQSAQAASFDLNLNDYSLQAKLAGPVSSGAHGDSLMHLRFLYNEKKSLTMTSADLEFQAMIENVPGFGLGLGVGVVGGRKKSSRANQDIFGVPVGLRLYFQPAGAENLEFQGKVFYTPKLLSFADLDRMLERRVRAGYAISPAVQIYIEYQHIRANFDDLNSRTIDDNVRVGFKARF